LAKVGVPVFLPVYHRMTRYRGKTRTSQLPLFSGYVFCSAQQFVENHRVPPSCRSRVAQILRPLDPDRLRQELLTIAGLVTDRKLVQERVVGEIGDRIRITGGPLLGHEGKIVRLKPNRYAVIVEVSMIGARFQVELSEGMVARN
jgi:transcription antitermination factor NusG